MTPAALRLRAALLAVAVTPSAHADEVKGAWLLAGGYAGYSRVADHGAFAYGAEVSVMSWTKKEPFIGGWAQVGRVGGPHAYTRTAIGAEMTLLSFWTGLELGATRLWLDDGRHAHQIVVAPYVSLGLASLSLRVGIPLDDTATSLGFDGSLVWTLKFLPYPFGDPGPEIGIPHGRPLASGPAPVALRSDWS